PAGMQEAQSAQPAQPEQSAPDTGPPPVDASLPGAEPSGAGTDAPTELLAANTLEPTSVLDSLFTSPVAPPAEQGTDAAATTVLPKATAADETPKTTRPSKLGKEQRTMLWVAGSLVAAL